LIKSWVVTVGNTRVFQKRKFSGVSFCEGGFPRFTAMEELDEELDMITDGERLGCGFRFWFSWIDLGGG
jgi:hypothetical protein